jgi:DNA repair exonuclease SbcCD ATPase subunit
MKRNLIYNNWDSHSVKYLFVVPLLLCSFFTLPVRADDHEERVKAFQTAINYMQDKKGCTSIPYADLQDKCQRKQNEVNKWCKPDERWNCAEVDPKKIQEAIHMLKKERDELKSEKEELERKKPSVTEDSQKREIEDKIKGIENKLYELERTRGVLEKQVSEASKTVNDRMYVGKACLDARPSVQEVYNDAKSRANGEHDPDIAPLAKRLIEYWEAGEQKHKQAIDDTKTGVEDCERILDEIGHLGNP